MAAKSASRGAFRAFVPPLALIFQLSALSGAFASDWPPVDPNQEETAVVFTKDWASTLRNLQSFRQLQERVGARGKIVESDADAETPYVVFQWKSIAPDGRKGALRAKVYSTGDFGAIVSPIEGSGDIVLNNFGAFVCAQCSPAVNACGHRPSWVPHDLHWDNFDCHCTLTGPQSVNDRQC